MSQANREVLVNTLQKIQDGGALVVTILGGLAAVFLIVNIRQWQLRKQAEKSLERARIIAFQARNKISPATVRVRQTDIVENMNQSDKIRHREAKELVARGEILAAAKIFEAVKFQRQAIDILEENGYYDQAAEILLKMKAVNLVAMLYERNKQFYKSLVYFEKAGLHGDAGRVCLVLAKLDTQFYWAAAQHYRKSGNDVEALAAYSQVLAFNEMFELARDRDLISTLFLYIEIHSLEEPLLALMSDSDLSLIIDSSPATPRYLNAMLKWERLKPSLTARRSVLKKIVLNENAISDFWEKKVPANRPLFRDALGALNARADRAVIFAHAFEIDRRGEGKEALQIFLDLKMNEEAAFFSIKIGMIDAAKELLPNLSAEISKKISKIIDSLQTLDSQPDSIEYLKIIDTLRPKDWPGPVLPQEPSIDLKLISEIVVS
jgi:hypothetical protein